MTGSRSEQGRIAQVAARTRRRSRGSRLRRPHGERGGRPAQSTRPAIQSRRPSPSAAASVPLTIASARGAPPSRIGSVSARCTGASKPATGRLPVEHQISAPPPKLKKLRKKELEAANAIDRPKTIWISRRKPPDGVAERERQAGDDDDDHRDDLGDRPLDRIRGSAASGCLPGHAGAGGVARARRRASATAAASATPDERRWQAERIMPGLLRVCGGAAEGRSRRRGRGRRRGRARSRRRAGPRPASTTIEVDGLGDQRAAAR